MSMYVAPAQNMEVIGLAVQGYLAAMGDAVLPIAEKHGFGKVEPYEWYSYQALLDLIKEISGPSMNSVFDLVKIGMRASEMYINNLDMPPSLEEWLLSNAENYKLSMRGFDNPEQLVKVEPEAAEAGKKKIKISISEHEPTDCDLLYGLFYGATRLLRPKDVQFTVKHRPDTCRKKGHNCCILDIEWEEAT